MKAEANLTQKNDFTVQNADEDAIRNRLKAYMEVKHLTQAELARLCNFPPNQLSMYLSGQTKTLGALHTFPRYCDINLNWLYTGQGPMTVTSPIPAPAAPTVSIESKQFLDIACLDNIMIRAQEIIDMKPTIVEGSDPDWRFLFFEQLNQNKHLTNEMSKILGQLELYKQQAVRIHHDMEAMIKELAELKAL